MLRSPNRFVRGVPGVVAGAVLVGVVLGGPAWQKREAGQALRLRLDRLAEQGSCGACVVIDRVRAARVDEPGSLLASWQTVGGCGAGATTGAGSCPKWIGRNVSGGLFNVQDQACYTPLLTDPQRVEHQFFLTTLVSRDIDQKWSLGVSVPVVYKYLRDPYKKQIDLSNSGLGDVYVQAARKFGAINDTTVTASLGLPTGKYDQQWRMEYLRQHQQLGFGKLAGALMLDHVVDETWGLLVIGGTGAWRGGQNSLGSYRAPSGTVYGYAGYFWGALVPAVGLSVTGLTGHDRDRGQEELTGLAIAAPSLSLEWANPWIAVWAGASLPLQYDGVPVDANGRTRSPWGLGSWSVGLGLSIAPF
jgi:hypothetical protein